ncbi:MAG: hypothetical protein HY790_03375 [Deltaproteobacteria bacterium]|nr:hypothetical protein [Deltaproteobacteria bacterium]
MKTVLKEVRFNGRRLPLLKLKQRLLAKKPACFQAGFFMGWDNKRGRAWRTLFFVLASLRLAAFT